MKLFAAVLLLQAILAPRPVEPALQFPEPGVDDPAAYEGYQTRFYQDAPGNTLQIYLNQRDGRVVNVWGNAANESLGFTVRNAAGEPAPLSWGAEHAIVDADGRRRGVEYRLQVGAPVVEVGHFLLGSMRVERDFQHFEHHRQPWEAPGFPRPELASLIANLERFERSERRRQLEILQARRTDELRGRLQPAQALQRSRSESRIRVAQPSFDGRNQLMLELRVDRREAEMTRAGDAVAIRSRTGAPISLIVRVTTDAAPLTPLRHTEIFSRSYLGHLAGLRAAAERAAEAAAAAPGAASAHPLLQVHRLERQVRSMELLSSREKLMAGLPNYGTYFGRDMLMTALMMQPVWTEDMAEAVIGSVFGKLSPDGEVSHEEALGGQAIREHAALYNSVLEEHFAQRARGERAAADSSLAEARRILANLQTVRESYHMLDDDFQFPVFVARYLRDPAIPAARKRAFLREPVEAQGGATRLALLLRNLAYVARSAEPYTRNPSPTNLIGFPRRTDTDWFPGSWRDSNVGYANGRFAMDINVVWVPAALESVGEIVTALRQLGLDPLGPEAGAPELQDTPLADYVHDRSMLERAVRQWNGTAQHFLVGLSPAEVGSRVQARLARMPAEERQFWSEVFERHAPTEELRFLALSLDADGRPIPVVNTDVGMRLFIKDGSIGGSVGALSPDQVLRDVRAVLQPYPVGLFVSGLGPLVANDAYASPEVWEAFLRDHYHSPRVVWGREVNLVLLGIARQIQAATDPSGATRDAELTGYVEELRRALHEVQAAVQASGLADQELWSYRIEGGRLLPLRYAASTDIQLWNLTALAVQYELARLEAGAQPATAPAAVAIPGERSVQQRRRRRRRWKPHRGGYQTRRYDGERSGGLTALPLQCCYGATRAVPPLPELGEGARR